MLVSARAAPPIATLIDVISALRRSVRAADWNSCDREARDSSMIGHRALGQVLEARTRDRERATALRDGHERLRAAFEAMAHSARAETFFGQLRDRLGPTHRDAFDGSLSSLARGVVDGVPLLDELGGRTSLPAQMRDLDGDLAIAAITQGLLGRVHSSFNRGVDSYRRSGSSQADSAEKTKLQDALQEVEAGSLHRLRQLFSALESRAEAASGVAAELGNWIAEVLPQFASDQARALVAYERGRATGRGDVVVDIGELLARSALQTRICVAIQAAAHRVTLELARLEPRDDARSVLRPSGRCEPADALPNGARTALPELRSTAPESFVEVSGIVSGISAERIQDKLMTIVSLTTPQADATARALIRFAHLPHAGLTEGAYFRASGSYRPTDAGATIEVKALPLSEMARDSWTIGLLRLARPWFQPWRTNALASWSLGVHAPDGRENRMGAGELLFTDSLRMGARG